MKGRQAVLGTVAAAATVAVVALALAVPAAADPPTAVPFEFVFDDVNPSLRLGPPGPGCQ